MKSILIFGSTGSVGKNALEVISKDKNNFKVIGLCANRDIATLVPQIKKYKPNFVCLRDETQAKKLPLKLLEGVKLFKGEKGLEEFSAIASDVSLLAISGISALKPLLINIKHSKRIALANKESIVVAAELVFKQAKKYNTEIIPVDSEINAIFQLIKDNDSNQKNSMRKVYLTASGGALADHSNEALKTISAKEVLKHPTWRMGQRITVDSATLVNKGFEAIETHCFFGFSYETIDIVIHRESVVHALVEMDDNSLIACLYPPDMKMPIAHSFYYPKRFKSEKDVNFKKRLIFSFSPIDYKRYPMLKIILKAAKRKDNSLILLNACDEVAIDYFLKEKIKYFDMLKAMSFIFNKYPVLKVKNVDDVIYWNNWAREKTKEYLNKLWVH